jgi:glucan phosphoethanolaminetransferase (alkaline phosphatase superfamily)
MNRLIEEFRQHRQAIGRYLLLSFLVMAPFVIWLAPGDRPLLRVVYVVFAFGLMVLAIASRIAFVAACLLLLGPALLHQHLSRHWGQGEFGSRVEVYFESPRGEMRQYVESHVDAIDVLFLVAAVGFVVALLRWTWVQGNAPIALRRAAVVSVVAGLALFAGLRLDRRIQHFLPYEIATQIPKAKERYELLASRRDYLAQNPLAGGECALRYDKIVVVLGESVLSDHMSVFGYARPTTPFAERSGAFAFDTLSPSNQTRYSLAMMLTPAAPNAFDGFFTSHSLVGELRRCGFHTLWISNQGRRGEYDSFTTSLAMEADEQIFLNEWSWEDSQLDDSVLRKLQEQRRFDRPRQATFIHLIGSHTAYRERVPAGFGFQDSPGVVTDYDNSILYTDQLLSELHESFSGGSLLFVYASDHGQIVTEDRFGSGFLPGFQEEFRTPMLIWSDDDEAVGKVHDALGGSRLNLESFDDVVRYLVGLVPEPRISTSGQVTVLRPDYVRDYAELESIRSRQK